MRCDRARELVGAYVDGELGGDDCISIAAHIESCAGCRELMADIRRTSNAIAELGREPAPIGLASRIRSRLAGAVEEQISAGKRLVPWGLPTSVSRQARALAAGTPLSAGVWWGAIDTRVGGE